MHHCNLACEIGMVKCYGHEALGVDRRCYGNMWRDDAGAV